MRSLHGERAIVTAAAVGIGHTVTKHLMPAGANVLIPETDGPARQQVRARFADVIIDDAPEAGRSICGRSSAACGNTKHPR